MEINKTEISAERKSFLKAQKKAKEIREFYINLSLFCIIMPVIIAINLIYVPFYHWFWFSFIGWGTGLIFHGVSTFEIFPFFRKDWEERKIQEILNSDFEREKFKNDLNK